MSPKPFSIVLLVAALGLTHAPHVDAASITGIDTGLGLVGPGVGTFTDGVRDAPAPDNQVGFAPLWDFTLRFEHPGYIDLPLVASPTADGANEYDLYVSIQNFSGQTWTGFRIHLGRGTGASFATASSDGLDFDTPDRDALFIDSGTVFTIDPVTYQEDLLEWTGGTPMTAGPSPTAISSFSFPIDVPDINDLTIRFEPVAAVPEPASTTLWIAAALMFNFLGCTRRAGPCAP